MTFQRVPACTQLERLGKSGHKVVVCRPSRSLGRDSQSALSRTSSLLNYRLHFHFRQQRCFDWPDCKRVAELHHDERKTLLAYNLRHKSRPWRNVKQSSEIHAPWTT